MTPKQHAMPEGFERENATACPETAAPLSVRRSLMPVNVALYGVDEVVPLFSFVCGSESSTHSSA